MAIYKAGRFLIDGNTFDTEADYVGKEYDAAKRELERISDDVYNIYKKYPLEKESILKVFIALDYGQQILSCFCDKTGIYFAKCYKNTKNITTIFSADDTKKIAQISNYFIYKTENIMRALCKDQHISQSTELEKISIENIRQKIKKDLEEYER